MTIHQRKDAPTVEPKPIDERTHQPEPPREPNEKLAAALEEARRMKPRFKSAQELFDALDREGQK